VGHERRARPGDTPPRESPFLGAPAGVLPEGPRPYSERTAELVDTEVQRILQDCYAEAKRLLEQDRDALEALAHALLERETLDEAEIRRVTGLISRARVEQLPAPLAPAAFLEIRPKRPNFVQTDLCPGSAAGGGTYPAVSSAALPGR
jgi:Peptidase family M41